MKVLVLDDEVLVQDFLKTFLESHYEGCECYTCGSLQEFKELNVKILPDFYILDVVLLNGQIFSVLDQFDPSRAILLTGYASDRVCEFARACNFHRILPKPVDGRVLKDALDSLLLKASSPSAEFSAQRLIRAFPRLFDVLARNLVDGQKVQECVEIIGQALDATVIVSPYELHGGVSFPLFGYAKDGAVLPSRFELPAGWVDRLLSDEVIIRVGRVLASCFEGANRVLAVPVNGNGVKNWGFFLTFDERSVLYSQEEVEFVKSVVNILSLALLRLQHNTLLENLLFEVVQKRVSSDGGPKEAFHG